MYSQHYINILLTKKSHEPSCHVTSFGLNYSVDFHVETANFQVGKFAFLGYYHPIINQLWNKYFHALALFIRLIIRLFQLVFSAVTNIFLSQQISQQYFSAGLSAQPNGAIDSANWFIRGFVPRSLNLSYGEYLIMVTLIVATMHPNRLGRPSSFHVLPLWLSMLVLGCKCV
jgi:hypothetical protein